MFLLRATLLSALLLTAIAVLPAPAVEPSDYLMDLWTSDENLPDTTVTSITQTPDGYLWIGTYNGLARFDGVRFTHFDPLNTPALKHARVHSLLTDANGTLWISTYDGSLTSFRKDVFTHEWQGARVEQVFSVSNRLYFASLARSIVMRTSNASGSNQWQPITLDPRWGARYFCQDAVGTLWCLLENGRLELISGTNALPLSEDAELVGKKINCLATDPVGRVWVGTDNAILRWDGERFVNETPTNSEPPGVINFIFCTASNGIWAIAGNSVRHAVNRQWVAGTDSWSDLAKSNPFYIRAYEESNGNVWFCQNGIGLFCAGADGTFLHFSPTNGLPNNRVSCWLEDREGNLWVGTEYGGLLRLRQRQFQIIGGDSLKGVPVTTVCEDSHNNVWFGTFDHGLNRWHDGQLESFNLPNGVSRNTILSACLDAQDRLWLSADREDLFMLEINRIHRAKTSIHGIKAMLADSQGRIWLGRPNQRLTYIADGKTINFGPREGFEGRDVRALAADRQNVVWIGTGNGLLYQFANGLFTAFKPEDSLTNQAVWSLLPDDDGSVWVGTFRGGLLRFKDGKFTRYTTSDGLPSDVISQILDDGLGRLWFGSYQGIFYVSKVAFAAFDQGKIQSLPCVSYGLHDGLPTLQCFGSFQPAACHSRDGRLWFATVKGLVMVDPRKVQVNQLPPPVIIEACLVDGKSIGTTGTIHIAPGRHRLEIQFTALSFTAPDKVKFRYRLKGIDTDWSKPDNARNATFGPLSPGNYQFQVIACNNDGIWNETGAILAITQQPFFWQTWWFFSIALVAGGLVIAAAVSYAATRRLQQKLERLKQQRAIDNERERIAKDIHDDLGAGLTQIMFQSSLARNDTVEQMKTDFVQIAETARSLVGTMDEIVWAINPEKDTLDALVSYLGKFANDFLTSAKVRGRFDLPTGLPHIIVPANTRHNAYLAIKEALNNVVKHAQATEVMFKFQMQPDAFTIVIEDNGVGLAGEKADSITPVAARISSGYGLRNLTARLESIGGSCNVVSNLGRGTRIELIIPFNNHKNNN